MWTLMAAPCWCIVLFRVNEVGSWLNLGDPVMALIVRVVEITMSTMSFLVADLKSGNPLVCRTCPLDACGVRYMSYWIWLCPTLSMYGASKGWGLWEIGVAGSCSVTVVSCCRCGPGVGFEVFSAFSGPCPVHRPDGLGSCEG